MIPQPKFLLPLYYMPSEKKAADIFRDTRAPQFHVWIKILTYFRNVDTPSSDNKICEIEFLCHVAQMTSYRKILKITAPQTFRSGKLSCKSQINVLVFREGNRAQKGQVTYSRSHSCLKIELG